MEANCEVIGWLFVDAEHAQVLVREESGGISSHAAAPDGALGRWAIQTGVFRRGAPIIDPVTHETLGYEMESVYSFS